MSDAAELTGLVLGEEAARRRASSSEEVVLPDDMLPGVGDDPIRITDALRAGGASTLVVLTLLSMMAAVERTGLVVLGPDIQKTLDVSDAVLAAITGASGALFVLGAVPFGVLADRLPRLRITAVATLFWSACLALSGAAASGFQLFCSRLGVGLGEANELPVHGPVLIDRYPIAARGRVFATHGIAGSLGGFVGPLAAGGLAAAIGGTAAWRWVFVIFAVPPALLALATFALPEPARGSNEQLAVLGDVLEATSEMPVSMTSAFERLTRIETFRYVLLAVAVLGFALFSAPLLLSLFLEHHFGLSALGRGTVFSIAALGPLAVVPLVGSAADRIMRRAPGRVLLVTAGLLTAYGIVLTVALFMPTAAALTAVLALAQAMAFGAFVTMSPITAAVVPYRLRSQGFALVGVYLFLFGAFAGLLLTGALADAFGERMALVIVAPAACIAGSALLAIGSRHVRRDISLVVEELLEEQADAHRRALGDAVPVLEVRNLDFSYGNVQVLFSVDLEVRQGEVVALVGTNGAGKSTLLRVISGLGIPQRGVVRFCGRTITLVDPERRIGMGIVHVRGGAGVFPDLSVDENLDTFLLHARLTAHERDERRRRVFEAFPPLGVERHKLVRDLSGGQQQQVAVSAALVQRPELLIIDELSLGLAPIVVEELFEIVDGLRRTGTSMLIVEQSLNIAAAIADRAVFMEKGAVRYVGPAHELLEREELARSVFLGSEDG
ncbi:MAG TPA: ATP-binding protein [Acidimicrobiia bacterium]|jgi:ABC-type branched-subunit amino acid transport system ATPase component/sugar phosphate permease